VALDAHLDGLFAETAVGGLWPRFYQCSCGRFGLDCRHRTRSSLVATRFCSDACRTNDHREKKNAKKRERARSLATEYRELRDRNDPDALDIVARRHGLSPTALDRLIGTLDKR
jgi:hypothetical protein